MRRRVPAFLRHAISWIALAALLVPASVLQAQTSAPPTSTARISVGVEAFPAVIEKLLETGRSLELSGRWGDALTHYEEALREYPQDRSLQARFETARLHYSLKQRYDDRSFRESVRTLRSSQAQELTEKNHHSDYLRRDQDKNGS
jgi:tetratricopeptide (TPR) repeat protein